MPAYHDVTKAMEDRDRQVNEAEAEARLDAEREGGPGPADRMRAEAARDEKILEAETERRPPSWPDRRRGAK